MLHREGCSCVITDGAEFRMFHQRGVKDLYDILSTQPELLRGAFIADKVVGKGAAALMILGGIDSLYTDTISEAALELFARYNIEVKYDKLVPHIINRAGTGMCPVESLCEECGTAEECLPLIKDFIERLAK
ncbi:MAG: DUF1893 domain-containing protein [Alistipes sp.]|nr:DUF1893 domain-containing protein [Alistipes sp.]